MGQSESPDGEASLHLEEMDVSFGSWDREGGEEFVVFRADWADFLFQQ